MRRKMFVMPLAAAMVLSAVPAFASEGTSSAEETVEETSEASSAEVRVRGLEMSLLI